MTTERDLNLLIATWLDEGPRDLPSDTRRAIETAVRTMPQRRRGFGPSWRFPTVNGSLRPALLVAAVLISILGVAVYGRLRPADDVGGGLPRNSGPAAPGGPVGRLVFTPHDDTTGAALGLYLMDVDGSDQKVLRLPLDSDGAWWSPDASTILLGNSFLDGRWRPALMQPDGTDYRRLETPGDFEDMYCGAWSADAARLLCSIAQASDPMVAGVVTVDATTGGDLRRLTSGANPGIVGTISECGGGDQAHGFSPDGTEFLFTRHICGQTPDPVRDETAELYIGKVDGSAPPRLLLEKRAFSASEPATWSPDGTKILYNFDGRIWTVQPDGLNRTMISVDVPAATVISGPRWSPDGGWIVFKAWHDGDTEDLYIARADGSDVRRLTKPPAIEGWADWALPAD